MREGSGHYRDRAKGTAYLDRALSAWRSNDGERPPPRALQRFNDLRREFDQPRQDEAPGADLDYRNVVLAQVLLEWQVRISGEQHIESTRDRRAEKLAVRHALPAALADMLRVVRAEVARESDRKVLIEEHAH